MTTRLRSLAPLLRNLLALGWMTAASAWLGCVHRADQVETFPAPVATTMPGPTLLGHVTLPAFLEVDGTRLGGLSGITYDHELGLYYAVSDDKGEYGAPRFYTLRIDFAEGAPEPVTWEVIGWTALQGLPTHGAADLEGISLAPDHSLYVSSEGAASDGLAPFIGQFSLAGDLIRFLALPAHYSPGSGGDTGVRDNLALESLTVSPDGRYLFSGTENALLQDGPSSGLRQESPSRLLRYDLARDRFDEFVYPVGPLHAHPPVPGAFSVNGLVELLVLDDESLLALERSFVTGVGLSARLFRVRLDSAEPVTGRASLRGLAALPVLPKEPFLSLDDLGLRLDNVEGMTLGPRRPDGRRSLVLVSDDNFSPTRQVTQLIVLTIP